MVALLDSNGNLLTGKARKKELKKAEKRAQREAQEVPVSGAIQFTWQIGVTS